MALHADSKTPGVTGKPASLCRRVTGICGSGRITVAQHVKRVSGRVAKSVLMRFYRKRWTRNGESAVLAQNIFLDLLIRRFFKFICRTVTHSVHQQDPEGYVRTCFAGD